MSATECEKLGVANKVFAEENFTEEVDSWAHRLAKRLLSKRNKRTSTFFKNNDYWSTFNKEIKIQGDLAKTDDFNNAVKAFFKKEKPQFFANN